MTQTFVVIHTIRQTQIPALLDSSVTNTPCVKMLCPKQNGFSLYFHLKKAYINLLKPTGHVMHEQFNIQQLYVLPTLYLSENIQGLVPLTA